MLPTSSELTYFLEVSQTLNFSRAAERLGITQPSLSLSIKKLEDNIGTTLFIRSKNGVHLTAAGEKLRVNARALLEDWKKLKAESLKLEHEICGHFVLGCHTAVANYTAPHFIENLCKEKDLEIQFEHGLSREITEKIISHKIDIGLVINPVKHPDLVLLPIGTDEVSFWVHKSLKVDNDTPLISDPALIQSTDLLKKLKNKSYTPNRFIHSSDLEVICTLTESKAGVGILPQRVATRKKNSMLKPLSSKLPIFKDTLCLAYRVDTPKTKAFQFIIDTLKKSLNNI